MFRIGQAMQHSPEAIGFHAPGLTGPFGAAVATGRLLKLDARQMRHAFGLAASMSGGLLNFVRTGDGGMVKRLHLGRAAEAGVLAAYLAQRGFSAPSDVLETPFGLLDAFCETSDAGLLTAGLGQSFQIEKLCIKRYACHVTAQVPVESLRRLMAENRFAGGDIHSLSLNVTDKVLSHHAERRPADIMLAQYSVPFSVAVAAFDDPENPAAFDQHVLTDPAVLALAEAITLTGGRAKGWGVTMKVRTHDGREFRSVSESFLGCPETPCTTDDMTRKFRKLTAKADHRQMEELLAQLLTVTSVEDVGLIPR
jgi:2-methylcitrate dehydratase PrpD